MEDVWYNILVHPMRLEKTNPARFVPFFRKRYIDENYPKHRPVESPWSFETFVVEILASIVLGLKKAEHAPPNEWQLVRWKTAKK